MRPLGDFLARLEAQNRVADGAESDCPECDDLGYISVPDGGAGSARLCQCQHPSRNVDQLRKRLLFAGMAERDIRSALAPWDESHQKQPQLLPWARNAATEAGVVQTPIVLYSPRSGVGKTKMASMMLAEFIKCDGIGGLWCSLPDAIGRVMAEKKEGPSDLERRILDAPFIVLEELRPQKSATEAQRKALELWLFRHHANATPCVITTNIDFAQAAPLCGLEPHIISRIREGRLIRMGQGCGDYREKKCVR